VIPGEGPYQVGTFWNFRWNDQHNRLEADFEPLGEALQETLETRWMRGELESVGVSLSAQCVTRGGIIVDRIEHMDYIDLVPRGALGGRFLPLGVASEALLLLRQPGEFADRDHRDRLRAYASVQRTLREIWNQKRPARVGGRAGGRLNRPIR
jgi:hypothetical protein